MRTTRLPVSGSYFVYHGEPAEFVVGRFPIAVLAPQHGPSDSPPEGLYAKPPAGSRQLSPPASSSRSSICRWRASPAGARAVRSRRTIRQNVTTREDIASVAEQLAELTRTVEAMAKDLER